MRELFGKQVLETDEEVLDPCHTALVVVDMQNDFGHPEGHFSRAGVDVSPVLTIVPRVAALVERARQSGVLVVWIRQTTLPGGRSDSPAWLGFKSRHADGFDTAYTLEGSWGQELLDPLAPLGDEPVVRKFRSSAFTNTSLDAVLRANGAQTVVVCGCMTEGCVESTARDAGFHDYYVAVAEDAIASNTPALHDAALVVMRSQFRVRPSAALVQAWAAAPVRA
jgi:ureidoacrylate peracid hydrolase